MAYCFQHAAYAVPNEEGDEGVGTVRRKEVNVKIGGREFLLSGGKDGVGVRDDEIANEIKNSWEWEGSVVVERNCDLRRLMAASLMSLKTPR